MRTSVEILNNPYTQRLRVLINGETVSVYSNLEKYMDEPFSYWCDKILDSIYEECNGENFSLHFCSRKEETDIMKKIVQDCTYCSQYYSSLHMRSTTLLERIKSLNNIIKKAQSSEYQTFRNETLFVIQDSLKRFETNLSDFELKNSFCQIVPRVMFMQDYGKKKYEADTVFFIGDKTSVNKCLQYIKTGKVFGIELGESKGFKGKINDIFVYESTEQTLLDIIFECLLFSPLLDMFRLCIKTMTPGLKRKFSDQIEELQSIEYKVIPVPENTTIEVGRSSRIHFKTDIEGYDVKLSQLHYSYNDENIIYCNGLLVEGLKEGTTTLYIFKEGDQIPCANVKYTVIKRNRIKELKLEDDYLTIGEGDRIKLNLMYLPADADNANSIEWKSEDEKIAKVDNSGYVVGISRGSCIVRCFAEQISTTCRCTVKPHLKAILAEEREIEMIYGQERELKIDLKPENCIDDKIIVSSIDMQIVNVVDRTLKAIGIGTTRVIIQNVQETVKAEIIVCVITEAEYRNRQKGREKSLETVKKKKGWLSKLFG